PSADTAISTSCNERTSFTTCLLEAGIANSGDGQYGFVVVFQMVPNRSAIMRARFALSHREFMTDKKLDPADLAAITGRTLNHYDRFAESFWEGTRDHDVSQNIDALLQHIGAEPPFTLLDFGCGPGRDLKVFIERGHMAIGLEGSARFAQMARAYSGCEVWQQ